jgi:hypothetical protein
MKLHTIGIDLGKTVFHLVGLNLRGEESEVCLDINRPSHGRHNPPPRQHRLHVRVTRNRRSRPRERTT